MSKVLASIWSDLILFSDSASIYLGTDYTEAHLSLVTSTSEEFKLRGRMVFEELYNEPRLFDLLRQRAAKVDLHIDIETKKDEILLRADFS